MKSMVFYMWFDKQAMQIRYNTLEGDKVTLPFGCMINLVQSPDPILEDFINTTQYYMHNQDIITEGTDSKDDIKEEHIQDVYVKVVFAKGVKKVKVTIPKYKKETVLTVGQYKSLKATEERLKQAEIDAKAHKDVKHGI